MWKEAELVGEDERGEEDDRDADQVDEDVDRVVVVLAIEEELVLKIEDRVRFGGGQQGGILIDSSLRLLLSGARHRFLFFLCVGRGV